MTPDERAPGGRPREEKLDDWWSRQAETRVDESAPRVDWTCSGELQRMINKRVTGGEDRNWIGRLRAEWLPGTLELGLSVGCGTGLLERDAIAQGLCSRMEGVDIAAGALAIAREAADGLPVTYRRLDLEREELPGDTYDIVFCAGTLHHVNRLDFCLGQVHAALKEGGLFVLFEYAGPSRFQWAPLQLEVVQEVYSFLPPGHRYNYQASSMMPLPRRPEISAMVLNDPSEAVRSGEMLEVVERYFQRLDRRPVGGTVLNPLLGGILENFDEDDELDVSFLRLAALLEEMLLGRGTLPSDFVHDIYRKRPVPLGGDEAGDADRARSDLVSAQEQRISGLCETLAAARRENEELAGRLHGLRREAGLAGEETARQQARNSGLKTGLAFRAARAVGGLLREARGPLAPACEERLDQRSTGREATPGPVRDEQAVRPSVAYIEDYLESAPGEELWSCWAKRVLGGHAPDAAFAGSKAWHAAGLAPAPEDRESLVVVERQEADRSLDAAFLERLRACLPRDLLPAEVAGDETGRDYSAPLEPPPGYELVGEKSFNERMTGTVAQPLRRAAPQTGMERAVAGLTAYVLDKAVETGELSGTVKVRVFHRHAPGGSADRALPEERSGDIVTMQAGEIERLKGLLGAEDDRDAVLMSEISSASQELRRTEAVQRSLRREEELLSRGGLRGYAGLFKERRLRAKLL